jgi:DNA-binding XRE family transcriptional regulator
MKLTKLTNEETISEIALYIRTRRKYLSHSQQSLADAAGIKRLSVLKIEQGKNYEICTLISILRVLKCDLSIKP